MEQMINVEPSTMTGFIGGNSIQGRNAAEVNSMVNNLKDAQIQIIKASSKANAIDTIFLVGMAGLVFVGGSFILNKLVIEPFEKYLDESEEKDPK